MDLVLGWNPVVGGVVEGCGDYEDGPGGDEGSSDEAADDLALGACKGDREAVGDGEGRGAWEKGGGAGEDVEAAVEGDGGAGSWGGLAEGDVGNGTGAGEYADAHVLAAAEAGNSLNDVASAGDLKNVRAHGGVRVAGDEDRGLGLVFGSRWTAPGPPHDFDGGPVAFGGGLDLLELVGRRGGVSGATAASAVVIFGGLLLAFTWGGGGGDLVEWMRKWVEELVLLVLVLVVKLGEHAGSFTVWFYIFAFHVGNFPLFIPLCIICSLSSPRSMIGGSIKIRETSRNSCTWCREGWATREIERGRQRR
jgi:hypothetical protein